MAGVAQELTWREEDPAGGWDGPAPVWPFLRPMPSGLEAFTDGARLTLKVVYLQAHPMVPPLLYPVDPVPELDLRTRHAWHLNGDGSLCLLRRASDWDPVSDTAADLVVKASGWFLEYLLLSRGQRDAMSDCGIVEDAGLDHLLVPPDRTS